MEITTALEQTKYKPELTTEEMLDVVIGKTTAFMYPWKVTYKKRENILNIAYHNLETGLFANAHTKLAVLLTLLEDGKLEYTKGKDTGVELELDDPEIEKLYEFFTKTSNVEVIIKLIQ